MMSRDRPIRRHIAQRWKLEKERKANDMRVDRQHPDGVVFLDM